MPKIASQAGLRRFVLPPVAALLVGGFGISAAGAYVGDSFLRIPGLESGSRGPGYKSWIKFESTMWMGETPGFARIAIHDLRRMKFTVPGAPRDKDGQLALALDKRNPALGRLMGLCAKKEPIAEVRFAESADLARPAVWWGKRPANVPAFIEYALKDVTMACPAAAPAPEQAFVLTFKTIEWLNYTGGDQALTPVPPQLPPAQTSGVTKSYVLTYFGEALDVSDKQCPILASAPTIDDYYALVPPEEAAREKAANASTGGLPRGPVQAGMCLRGPDKLNVCQLPGLVPDPGNPAPQSSVAKGLDLDGRRGAKHAGFVSPDGAKGVDNQLFTVKGCIPGFKRNGLLVETRLDLMRNGLISMIVQVGGIDSEQDDPDVDVTFLYSQDPMVKNASGSQILPKYTFSLTQQPELRQFFKRIRGRIENGVIVTDPIDEIQFFEGSMQRMILRDAKARLTIVGDGTVKGVVGGYFDWREVYNFNGTPPGFERGMSLRSPGLYFALKRAADGLRNQITGDFDGISSAFEFEGVQAFIPPSQQRAIAAGTGDHARKAK